MQAHLKTAEVFAKLLDNQFSIGKFRFGLDPILGLFWGAGDIVGALLSCYMIWIAIQMKIPSSAIAQMLGNIALDFLIGLVPVLGQATDFVFKANSKNMEILRKYAKSTVVEGHVIE